MTDQPTPNTMWLTGYTADGFKVSFTLEISTVESVLHNLELVRAAGILPREQGLEAGEETEVMGYALRAVTNDTPRIFFYPANERLTWKWIDVYLNTDTDYEQFEAVTGLKLDSMKVWPAGNPPERGASGAAEYIVPLKQSVRIVRKVNPKHDPAETDVAKKKAKHFFVRYADAPQVVSQTAANSHQTSPISNGTPQTGVNGAPAQNGTPMRDWKAVYAACANIEHFEGVMKHLTNAVQVMFKAGELPPTMTDEQVIYAIRTKYAPVDVPF